MTRRGPWVGTIGEAEHWRDTALGLVANDDTEGFVYFIQHGRDARAPIKIGWATDVRRRLAELQAGTPEELYLLTARAATPKHERRLHQKFAGARVRGEWFLPTRELVALTEEEGPLAPLIDVEAALSRLREMRGAVPMSYYD